MKISKDTLTKIDQIKTETAQAKRILEDQLIRLKEHPGTKMLSKKLEKAIVKVDEFQKVA